MRPSAGASRCIVLGPSEALGGMVGEKQQSGLAEWAAAAPSAAETRKRRNREHTSKCRSQMPPANPQAPTQRLK